MLRIPPSFCLLKGGTLSREDIQDKIEGIIYEVRKENSENRAERLQKREDGREERGENLENKRREIYREERRDNVDSVSL